MQKDMKSLVSGLFGGILSSVLIGLLVYSGTNSLSTVSTGQIIRATHVNQFHEAMRTDHVPRNASGVATSLAGQLGTSLLIWDDSYIDKLFIGLLADNMSIEDDATDMVFKRAGIEEARLEAGGWDTGSYQDLSVTRAKLEPTDHKISSSSGTFTTSSTTYTAVTNLSISITTVGRPVWISVQSDGSAGALGRLRITPNGGANCTGFFRVLRDAVLVAEFLPQSTATELYYPPQALQVLDTPTSGTYNYTVQAHMEATDCTSVGVEEVKLTAYEL